MALSDEEKATLKALQAKENEPDEDFPIEIWDESGAGARLPYSRGRGFLKRFGLELEEGDSGEGSAEEPTGKPKLRAAKVKPDNSGPAQRYFGKDKAS